MTSPTPGFTSVELGGFIPPNNQHGVCVSMPTWSSTVGWARREPAIVQAMKTCYPRMWLHKLVDELGSRMADRFDREQKQNGSAFPEIGSKRRCMLFPSSWAAKQCCEFLQDNVSADAKTRINLIRVSLPHEHVSSPAEVGNSVDWEHCELHAVLYPPNEHANARAFWQKTGFGISSRYAERCVSHFKDMEIQASSDIQCDSATREMTVSAALNGDHPTTVLNHKPQPLISKDKDQSNKLTIRQRIAQNMSTAGKTVDIDDVYLFPTGMSGITYVAQALRLIHHESPSCKIVCFGMLYMDTIKTIALFLDMDVTLLAGCSSPELDELESQLASGHRIAALFLEVPGNPLLNTPDLQRIRRLADVHNFVVVCDDTVATCANVDVLPFVDVVCTSLTKMFSGYCDVMGGSVVLKSSSQHYESLSKTISSIFIDAYYPEDAAVMEQNSRNFLERVQCANKNAEIICDFLRQDPLVKTVHYPKGSPTQALYDACRKHDGGYGYLLSIIFVHAAHATAFYEAIQIFRGPSFGTVFTLACPGTLLVYEKDREWAAKYGMKQDLIRVSIGLEDPDLLKSTIQSALEVVRNTDLVD